MQKVDRRRRQFKTVRKVATSMAHDLGREINAQVWRAAELNVLAADARLRALAGPAGSLGKCPTANDLVRLERLASAALRGLGQPGAKAERSLREVLSSRGGV